MPRDLLHLFYIPLVFPALLFCRREVSGIILNQDTAPIPTELFSYISSALPAVYQELEVRP
jgi:hypothetical protein